VPLERGGASIGVQERTQAGGTGKNFSGGGISGRFPGGRGETYPIWKLSSEECLEKKARKMQVGGERKSPLFQRYRRGKKHLHFCFGFSLKNLTPKIRRGKKVTGRGPLLGEKKKFFTDKGGKI